MGRASKLKSVPVTPLRLDFGCGKNKRDGFTGVDICPFDGVDVVLDLAETVKTLPDGERVFMKWPWADHSVTEAHASHFVEHLTPAARINFVNQLYRVLQPGGTCQIIVPHWASCRAYGDLTHQWPPVSEFWFYYLNKDWRAMNAPHNDGYTCHFEATWGYALRADLLIRHQEHQQFAIANYKEAAQDVIATLKALK